MEPGIAMPPIDEATFEGICPQSRRVGLAVGRNGSIGTIEIAIALTQLDGPPKTQVADCGFNTDPVQIVGHVGNLPVNPECPTFYPTAMTVGIHPLVEREGRAAEADTEGQTALLAGWNDLRFRRED